MIARLAFSAIATVIMAAQLPAQSAPVVDVSGGRIRGEAMAGGGAVFKGIPYAAPPTGQLRWREPMPVRGWTGTRDATTFGAICPQNPSGPMPNPQALMSEDCLSLNVWIPEWPIGGARPVLVWIPGGANINGGTSQARHDGQHLARRGLVVVSLNYRLGSFGFFSHPALSAESTRKVSGNQGLRDQIAALKWVHNNIARLGGDPGLVTVAGESAGGIDISALMTSPLAEGLFVRAIVTSGSAHNNVIGEPLPLKEAERLGAALAATWGGAVTDLRTMRAVPMQTILDAQPTRPVAQLNVSVDGYVLRTIPDRVFAAGRQRALPAIIGNAARDFTPGSPPPTNLATLISERYGPLADRALRLYTTDDPLYGTPEVQWATDIGFRCDTIVQSIQHVNAGHPTFAFEFARLVDPPIQPGGNIHGLHGQFALGTMSTRDQGTTLIPMSVTPADISLSDVVQQYWANFTKTGDPNGPDVPAWPAFRAAERAYLEMASDGITVKRGLRRAQCDLYIENAERLVAPTRGR
jgi:para-nitrobenzyl esterase